MAVSMRLWQAPGCHEFLASLGFDLLDVGKDEVTVKAGKQANRRILQFGLQALVAIFGKLPPDHQVETEEILLRQKFFPNYSLRVKSKPVYPVNLVSVKTHCFLFCRYAGSTANSVPGQLQFNGVSVFQRLCHFHLELLKGFLTAYFSHFSKEILFQSSRSGEITLSG